MDIEEVDEGSDSCVEDTCLKKSIGKYKLECFCAQNPGMEIDWEE